MPKVEVNDIEMYYEVYGEGPPLLLIQGYSGSSADWTSEIIQGFEDEFKVITFDNRGTGRSGKPDVEYSIEVMADDAARLMESIGIKEAYHMIRICRKRFIAGHCFRVCIRPRFQYPVNCSWI